MFMMGLEASALWYASSYGDFEQVKQAILSGANENAKYEDGSMPLHLACANVYQNDAVITLLLENGADVNAKKNDGNMPLHYASSNGYEAMVSILLESGADPTITNNKGKTPLQVAQEENKQNCVAAIEKQQALNKLMMPNGNLLLELIELVQTEAGSKPAVRAPQGSPSLPYST
jgi:ankyrin repeat protein